MAEPAFLLDSNICIYLLEGDAPTVRARVEGCRPGEVVTSAVAYAEVMRGVPKDDPTKWSQVEKLFETVSVLPFETGAAHFYASFPFRRGTFDRLIAAHAMSLGLTLVTNNTRDFADIVGLKIENWTI